MLQLKSVGCTDCLRVIDHLADYLDYHIDKDRNIILVQEDACSETITKVVDELKESGIDASPITSGDRFDENGGLPVKRTRHFYDPGGEFVHNVEQLAIVLEPANWCLGGHNVPAWCISVAPLSRMSSCISMLAQLEPLCSTLGHLKRAFVRQSDQSRVGKVLLGLASKSFTEEYARKLVSKLCEMADIPKGSLEACRVPLCPPHSCHQQKMLSFLTKDSAKILSWPTTFHPDPNLESLLSIGNGKDKTNGAIKPYFSSEEIKWHNYWLQRAISLTRRRASDGKNSSCDLEDPECVCSCVVIQPPSAKQLELTDFRPLVEAVSTDAQSCIDHAVMLAAGEVGRIRRNPEAHVTNGAIGTQVTPAEGYLLTGCDVYLAIEPCLMCSMALLHSRVARVFLARRLHSMGGLCSRWSLTLLKAVNHHFLVFAPAVS